MGRKIEAVIFDWAGTVVDYGCFAPVQAFLKAFEKKGITVELEEVRRPMGLLKRDHIKTMLGYARINQLWLERYGHEPDDADIDELYIYFEELLMESLQKFTNPIPGVVELVEKLRQKGMKIGSTTGYTKSMMEVVAYHAKRKGYAPDFMIASDELKAGRPYPYMIFRNLTELDVFPPSAVIKVGDTVSDMQEGKNAGVWSVAVMKGSSELGLTEAEVASLPETVLQARLEQVYQKFKEAGADFIIESIDQLPQVIEDLEHHRDGVVQ